MQRNKIIESSRWTASKTFPILLDIDSSYLMYQNLVITVTAGVWHLPLKELNWKTHCPRETKGHLRMLSMALWTGSLANKKPQADTVWKVLEQTKVA